MSGLYAIVDLTALERRGIDPLEFLEAVLTARPAWVQLRAKHESAATTLRWLRAFRAPCTRAGARLFANDRADLAMLAGADGVHLGQDDMPLEVVRRLFPELKYGLSTHDEAQLRAALALEADYVAFGPVFATLSKARPDEVVGLEGLGRASELSRRAGCPLVAIGGIDLERAPAVAKLAAAAAVIGALLPAGPDLEEVSRRAAALARALGG